MTMVIVMKIVSVTVMIVIMRCFQNPLLMVVNFVRYLNSSYTFSRGSSGNVDGGSTCTFCIVMCSCVYSCVFSMQNCSFLCRNTVHMQKSFRLYEHSPCELLNAVIERLCNHTSYNHEASLQCDSIYESLTSDL